MSRPKWEQKNPKAVGIRGFSVRFRAGEVEEVTANVIIELGIILNRKVWPRMCRKSVSITVHANIASDSILYGIALPLSQPETFVCSQILSKSIRVSEAINKR